MDKILYRKHYRISTYFHLLYIAIPKFNFINKRVALFMRTIYDNFQMPIIL